MGVNMSDKNKDIIKKQQSCLNKLQKQIYILERENKRLIDEKSDNDVVMTLSKIEELTDKQMEQVFLIIHTVASTNPGYSKDIYSILSKCYKELNSLNG